MLEILQTVENSKDLSNQKVIDMCFMCGFGCCLSFRFLSLSYFCDFEGRLWMTRGGRHSLIEGRELYGARVMGESMVVEEVEKEWLLYFRVCVRIF